MKRLFFLILNFLIASFVFAQALPYFSLKKTSGGIMIGVEILNQKTKFSLPMKGYIYNWTLPDISLITKKTNSNIFFLPLERTFASLIINLKIAKPLTKESYNFKKKISLSLPKVKIVRKQGGLLLPLETLIEKGDHLTFNLENVSSKNLQIIWEFNGVFLSNEKEIPVSLLKEKNGIIKVGVYGSSPNESAVDFKTITIE